MTIEIDDDHKDPQDSQVIIVLTGTSEYIREEIEKIWKECNNSYGKPVQGNIWTSKGQRQVVTEVWDHKKY